jgi:signal peptidase II
MKFIPFAIVAVWVAFDQWLKSYTVANIPLNNYQTPVDVLPGFLSFVHTENRGAAWSLFYGNAPILTVIRFVVGGAILYYVWRNFKRLPVVSVVAFSLIVGGAFGNAIDGAFRGHVVDMLLSHWLTAIYKPIFGTVYPIFNIADIGVVSGVILLLISSLFAPKPRPAQHSNPG